MHTEIVLKAFVGNFTRLFRSFHGLFCFFLCWPRLIAFHFSISLRPRTRVNYLPKCSRKITEKFTALGGVFRVAQLKLFWLQRVIRNGSCLRLRGKGGRQLLCKFLNCYSPRWDDLLIKEKNGAIWSATKWLKLVTELTVRWMVFLLRSLTELKCATFRSFVIQYKLTSLSFLSYTNWRVTSPSNSSDSDELYNGDDREEGRVRSMCHIHKSRFSFAITYDKDKEQLIRRKCFLILIVAEQNKKRFLIARKTRKFRDMEKNVSGALLMTLQCRSLLIDNLKLRSSPRAICWSIN